MARVWVTCGTPTIPAVVNPLTAACDRGYVPDTLHLLSNPGVAGAVDRILPMCESVIAEYGGELDVRRTSLDSETDFEAIAGFYRSTITAAHAAEDEVAVDVTPGRKFMSAISFQAGIHCEADHVFYFHRKSGPYRGSFYPEIPRSATNLIDFSEVI